MAGPTHPVAVIAKLLDLTPRRVFQLTNEGVIPRAERGRYELVPAVRGPAHRPGPQEGPDAGEDPLAVGDLRGEHALVAVEVGVEEIDFSLFVVFELK